MSDLHGHLPEIPQCDLVLVAGDLCPHTRFGRVGSSADIAFQKAWLGSQYAGWRDRVRDCVATFGNHDWAGQDPQTQHESEQFGVYVDDGLELGEVGIWCSPWSPWFYDWAFNAPKIGGEKFLAEKYAAIPDGVDIVVSHGPPVGYGDRTSGGEHVGSKALLDFIERRKPRLVVCGHIHEGYGVYHHPCGTTVVNASILDEKYRPVNAPIVFDLKESHVQP